MWLSGRSGNRLLFKNANQLLLSKKETEILKKILKFVERRKTNKDLEIVELDGITENDLTMLYDVFLNKLTNTVYHVRLSKQVKTLNEKRPVFLSLSLEEKCIVLSEILHFFQCKTGTANLKLLKGSGEAGKISISNNISKFESIQIIHQSVSGIYEQEIDLLKV